MANLIIESVGREQTGVATGMNTVMRTVGGALGAQVGATFIAANVSHGLPTEHGFNLAFLVATISVVLAVAASILVPGRRRAERHAGQPGLASEA
jgi:sugar phosphate permease